MYNAKRRLNGKNTTDSCFGIDQNRHDNSMGSGRARGLHNNDKAVKSCQQQSQGRGKNNPPARKQDQKPPGQQTTCWSYYHEGNVVNPEICVYSIDKRCMHEESGCLRLHAKCTSQWQVMHNCSWYNLRNFHSKEIEDAFEDVTKDSVKLTPLNPKMLGKSGIGMLKILGTHQWEANFESMVLKSLTSDGSPIVMMDIRRLSTQSAAMSKSAKSTVYEWFFQDKKQKWIKYGEVDSLGSTHLISSVKSHEIELNFSTNPSSPMTFNNSIFQYQLDFIGMKQTNLSTGKVRLVRRRPVKKQSTKINPKSKNDTIPSSWVVMKDTDTMVQITLDTSSQEYRDVMTLLLATLPSSRPTAIKRIQNPFLWRPFQNKQDELSLKYGEKGKINVQKLFHGTKFEYVDNICRENFDWRLHGSNIGQKYGRGTYFSNSAAFSLKYSPSDNFGHKFLLLAEVIVGKVTNGSPTMTRPPINPTTGELYDTTVDSITSPKIFVKYDKQEYYPLYILEQN